MGANSTQALGIALTLVGFTLLAGSFAGGGMLYGVLAAAALAAAAFFFMKSKASERSA